MALAVDAATNTATLRVTKELAAAASFDEVVRVRFELPEQFDVDVDLRGEGDVVVTGTKMESPRRLSLRAAHGSIDVGKVGGHIKQRVGSSRPRASLLVLVASEPGGFLGASLGTACRASRIIS
jgi:hypothetical protein